MSRVAAFLLEFYFEKAENGVGNEKVGEETADVHQACHGGCGNDGGVQVKDKA